MDDERAIRVAAHAAIPMRELHFAFTRSGGPGGQHVNKAATQVELTFDVKASPSLTAEHKHRVMGRLRGYVSKEGVLRLTCQTTRSQAQNRAEVVRRFQALMQEALREPKRRRPTKPTRASRERRLRAKKLRSQVKRLRRYRPGDDA